MHHIHEKFKTELPERLLQSKEHIIESCTSHHSEGFGQAQGYEGSILQNSVIMLGPSSRDINAASFEGPRQGRAQQQVQAVL